MDNTVYVAYAHYFNGSTMIIGVYHNREDAVLAGKEWEKDNVYCDWTDCEWFKIK